MNILVVNDDGIEAVGIRNLVETLSEAGNVYVSAPHVQRSASGHGITIGHPVRCEEVTYPGAALAYSFEGTPADCVKLGLEVYRERGIHFDRVFSGINHGGNLGTDILYSGTVSAAIEGSINGIPSIAISINAREAIQYETAKSIALRVAKADLAALDPRIVLNINLPDLPADQIKGVKWVKQGPREYVEWYNKAAAQDTGHGYIYSGRPVYYDHLDCDSNDVGANQEGYVSITPLHFDMTDYDLLAKLRDSEIL